MTRPRDCSRLTFTRRKPLRDARGRFASLEALLRESIERYRKLPPIAEPTEADTEQWNIVDLRDWLAEKGSD